MQPPEVVVGSLKIPATSSQVGVVGNLGERFSWFNQVSIQEVCPRGRIPNPKSRYRGEAPVQRRNSKILTRQQTVLATKFWAWKKQEYQETCRVGTLHNLMGCIISAQMLRRVSGLGNTDAQTLSLGALWAESCLWHRESLVWWNGSNLPGLLTESLDLKLSWMKCVCLCGMCVGCIYRSRRGRPRVKLILDLKSK